MKIIITSIIFQFAFFLCSIAQPSVNIVSYGTGLTDGISEIANAGDSRLFVAEQTGYIYIIQSQGVVLRQPFLDISNKVTPVTPNTESEQGLLGLAFSPDFVTDGNFYVSYTNRIGIGNSVISRFHISTDNNLADTASEQILLTIPRNFSNHNGGCLNFGPDGYLYCSFGDGGSEGDPNNMAQNLDTLLGKILRIDVSGDTGYTIPNNPFIGNDNVKTEIWDYGFRNPWKFSFDRVTKALWIADVGEDSLEEINREGYMQGGGNNYGWRCYEGTADFDQSACGGNPTAYTFPVYEYPHTSAGECAITGGYVYRGANQSMYGRYFFTDYCTGVIQSLDINNYTASLAGSFAGKQFTTFGEDSAGELYVGDQSTGTVYQLVANATSVQNINPDIPTSKVYPQPNDGNFTCQFGLTHNCRAEIEITDLAGKVIYGHEEDFVAGDNTFPISMRGIAAGMYMLKLSTSNGTVTHKFVVARP